MPLKNMSPAEVASALEAGEIVLVDVREPNEYAAARIPGAVLAPMSSFNPATLPDTGGKPVVFHCAVGGRSARAVAMCEAAGLSHERHLAGGIQAWAAAGLPLERGPAK